MKTWSDAETNGGQDSSKPRRARRQFLTAAVATLIVVFSFPSVKKSVLHCFRAKTDVYTPETDSFDWDKINATEDFEFHSCFGGFECAKLSLPIDYFNGTYPNETISIAIAKLPAKVPVDDPRYGGPILVNPGGPGGSGVQLALLAAGLLQQVTDPSDKGSINDAKGKFYDILGFDPRGIGWSEPPASCLEDNPSIWSWKLRETTEGILGSSDAALGRLWSMSHAFGRSCKSHSEAKDGFDIKKYMSTASVARDMIEIAEKHSEWAVDQANKLATKKMGVMRTKDVTKRQMYSYGRGSIKLNYLGFSYGTYLGSTFAAMFPDRVGRLVLDGVVDVRDYNDALGKGSLRDTEKDMKSFYTYCMLSGPEACPLATPGSTLEEIEQRVQRIIQSLYHSPIAINTDDGPEILTFSDIKTITFVSLYSPAISFPGLAAILADVEAGGGPVLNSIANALHGSHVYSCPIDGSPSSPILPFEEVAQDAILCGDGKDITHLDIDGMETYWRLLDGISPAIGSIWATISMRCAAWPIKPLFRLGDNDDNFHGNTSHPILWVSTTADPVTPLYSARVMAKRFPGSVVLAQDSAGHCSLSTPTACTVGAIKTYFQTGVLPPPDSLCAPPNSPWSLNSTDPNSPFYDPSLGKPVHLAGESLAEEDMHAARELQRWFAETNHYGMGRFGNRASGAVAAASAAAAAQFAAAKEEL